MGEGWSFEKKCAPTVTDVFIVYDDFVLFKFSSILF